MPPPCGPRLPVPLPSTVRPSGPRPRRLSTQNRRLDPLEVPPRTHSPLPHSFHLSVPTRATPARARARWSSLATASFEARNRHGKAAPVSLTVVCHRRAKLRHRSRFTRGEYSGRSSLSLSPVLLAPLINHRRSPAPAPPRVLLCPHEVTDSGHGARAEHVAEVDGNLDKRDPPAVSQP
jgi:hypothetical protein